MSGKASTGAAAKKIELTAREVEVLAAAWQSFKSDPEVDIPKLSQLVGFQNPRSAANLMGQIKKKLSAMEANGDFSVAAVPKTKPATPAGTPRGVAASASTRSGRAAAAAKRKTAAVEDAGAEADNEASEATPGPQKRRATGRGRKAAKAPTPVKEEEEVYDEGDGDDEGASASGADDQAQVAQDETDDQVNVVKDEVDDMANVVKDEAGEQPENGSEVKVEAHEKPKPKAKAKKVRDENDPITMFTNLNDTSDEDDI
ncbi:hypothetical protein KJ359_001988 [Pestalotiopsis sp. 9143b]|nr:hypothetical protein KJ359_001988 [Pestalotiopsis sp. 9143b]